MNLAYAVAIVAYEIYSRLAKTSLGRPFDLASLDQVEAFFDDLKRSLSEIGFLSCEDPKKIMATLRQILGRAMLEKRDVTILRGILRQSRWYAGEIQKRKEVSEG